MKRKSLSLLLALAMVLSLIPVTAFAAPEPEYPDQYTADLYLERDSTVQYNGQDTMLVHARMATGTAPGITAVQEVVGAVDLTRFDLVASNGKPATKAAFKDDPKMIFTDSTGKFAASYYSNEDLFLDILPRASYKRYSKDTNIGILGFTPQWDPLPENALQSTELLSLMSIRLGLKDGTTWDAIPEGSVRLATKAEATDISFQGVVSVNCDRVHYHYLKTVETGAPALTHTPTTTAQGFDFVVPPKDDPICVAPSGLTATYGDTLRSVSLTNPAGNTDGSWAWKNSSAKVGNTGEQTHQATFTPADTDKFNTVDVDVKITVDPKVVTEPTFEGVSSSYPFTGSQIQPTFTLKDGTDTIPASEYTVKYAKNINVGNDAQIIVSDNAGGNYEVSGTKTFAISAAAMPAGVMNAIRGYSGTYDGSAHNAVAGLPGPGYTVTYSDQENGSYTGSVPTVTKVSDSGTVWVKVENDNYETAKKSVTATVGQKGVTITGLTAQNKVYNGNNIALTTGGELSGKVEGDDLSITAGTGRFGTKAVGSGKTVTFSGYGISGADSGNYTLSAQPASTTANITAKPVTITIASATDKIYDGTDTASYGAASVNGVIDGDTVSVKGGTARFSDKNVDTGKTVTFSGFGLQGADSGNYTLSAQPASKTADITAADYTYTVPAEKSFRTGAKASAVIAGMNLSAAGTGVLVKGEAESVSGELEWFSDASRTVAVKDSDLSALEADASKILYWSFTTGDANYGKAVKQGQTTFTAKDKTTLTVSGVRMDADSYTYGDTVGYEGTPTTSVSGITGWTYNWFKQDNTPLKKAPTDAGNYKLVVSIPESNNDYMGSQIIPFTIEPKTLTAADLAYTGSALTKVYDETTASGLKSVSVKSGVLVGSDTLNITGTAVYNDENVALAESVTFTPNAIISGNYRLSAAETLEIPAVITPKPVTAKIGAIAAQTFTGKQLKPAVTVTGLVLTTDYTVSYGKNINAGLTAGSVTVSPVEGSNYTFSAASGSFEISQAAAPTLSDVTLSQKYTLESEQSKEIGKAGMPANAGPLTYAKGEASTTGSITVSAWNVDQNGKVTFTLTGGAAGDTVTLPVTVSSQNYADSVVNVKITLTDKDAQAALTLKVKDTVTFGKTLTLSATGGTTKGEVTYSVTNGTGKAAIEGNVLTATQAGTVTVTATMAGNADYSDVTSLPVTVTIEKAVPTGKPDYTKITGSGKTLADAALAIGTITPAEGTLKWDLESTTEVKANVKYDWTFTPADSVNYEVLTGTITLYSMASGGGGGAIIMPPAETYTVTLEKTENGTLTADAKDAESGAKITLTAAPAEGFAVDTITVTDKDGKTVAVTKGENNKYTFTMPAANVTVKATFKSASAPVFTDVSESAWYAASVRYVVDKGLMKGTSDATFAPAMNTSRGMIVTILYRLENSPAVTGDVSFADVTAGQWYTDAVRWAASNGIVKGYSNGSFGPNDPVTREQLAAILYRYAGSPKADAELTFADASKVSGYAKTAIAWAVQEKILTGKNGNLLDPQGLASRAEVSTMLMRFCENTGK